jgi:uncharacterized protein YkwD
MKSILNLIAILLTLVGCEKTVEPEPSLPLEMGPEIIRLVNEHRESQNLSLLETNELCTEVATSHSLNMAEGITAFGHDGFDSRREEISAVFDLRRIGENVAFGQTTATQVMESWLNSEGHRANIEGDFTHIGVGVAEDADGRLYYTQIFVKL